MHRAWKKEAAYSIGQMLQPVTGQRLESLSLSLAKSDIPYSLPGEMSPQQLEVDEWYDIHCGLICPPRDLRISPGSYFPVAAASSTHQGHFSGW